MSESRTVAGRTVTKRSKECPFTSLAVPVYEIEPRPEDLDEFNRPLRGRQGRRFTSGIHPRMGVMDAIASTRAHEWSDPSAVDPIDAEVAKLRELGLHASASLVEKSRPKGQRASRPSSARFDLGKIHVSPLIYSRVGQWDPAPMLARYAAGDLGDHGAMPDASTLSDEVVWFPASARGYAEASAAAVAAGLGAVVGRYHAGQPDPTREPVVIEVATVIDATHGNATVVCLDGSGIGGLIRLEIPYEAQAQAETQPTAAEVEATSP